MLSFLRKYGANYFSSQNGEEGCLLECLNRIHDVNRICVEVGGNNGLYCSNTALLLQDRYGWSGLFVEGNYDLYLESKQNWKDNFRVRHQCCFVNGQNVNAFVDEACDLFSTDTDGLDYDVFAGLIAKPKIVIVEIDSSILPGSNERNSDGACGYTPMVELGISKGYFLLCHTGNLIFVANEYRELFPEIEGDGLSNAELYFKRDWLKAEVGA